MNKMMIAAITATTMAGAALAQSPAPMASLHAPSNAAVKDSDVKHASMAAGGANSFTQSQARGRIAKAGYMHVSTLRKDKAGLWQGIAMRRGHKVRVALDYKGNVTSN